uniref:Uncharacterized protein n=1 Tax=Psilocybe cubensis TaxID=181762 RepID=A0A8H7XU24_PSICU
MASAHSRKSMQRVEAESIPDTTPPRVWAECTGRRTSIHRVHASPPPEVYVTSNGTSPPQVSAECVGRRASIHSVNASPGPEVDTSRQGRVNASTNA